MRPLAEIPEDEGAFRAPWACLNHLLPFHLRRRPLRVPPPAGAGWDWRPDEEELLGLVAALVRGDAQGAESALTRLAAAGFDGSGLFEPWWMGAAAFLSARLAALGLLSAIPPAARRTLLADALATANRARAVETELAAALALLGDAGIDALVLKGATFAHAWYPEPAARPVGDVDLLVAPRDLEPAETALLQAGWEPVAGMADAWTDHHHAPPLQTTTDGHPLVLELHAALAAGMDAAWTQALWERRGQVPAGDVALPALGRVDRLAHLALHHSGELGFRNLLDLLLAASQETSEDFARARERLPAPERWRMDLVLGVASDHLGDPALLSVIPARRRRAIERAAVEHWGRAYVVWMCRCGGRERPRHWLEPWRPRVHDVVRSPRLQGRGASLACAAGAYLVRQVRVAARVATDVAGFVLPRPAALGLETRWSRAYLVNAFRATKSVASRLVGGLVGRD